jgi:tetratricopeptide (TPR) repeat protein
MTTPNRIETPPLSARAQAAAAWSALYLKWKKRLEPWVIPSRMPPNSARAQAAAAWIALYLILKKRLESWADFLARFWAAYWLLIIGGFLIFGSAFLKWVQYPLTSNLSGLKFPLFHDSGVIPRVTLLSFGALGVVVFIAGVVLRRFFASALGLAAAVLITISVLTPAHIAFQQPMMLRHLIDELQATPWRKVFTKDYFPANYGSPEVLPNQLVLYTAKGRFLAAYSFLRLGWTCFSIGSVLVAVYAMRRLPDGKMAIGLTLVCLPLAALAIVITPPIIGQHYFNIGSIAKARGHDQEAIAEYRKAMKWDAWYGQDISLYATIGDLQKKSGIENNSPERHISQAVEFQQANEYEPAIFELGRAAEAGGAVAAAARRESAKTRIELGLALYQAGGIGGAITSWQLALADDPTAEVYVLPYLARGLFDVGRYEATLQRVDRLIQIIKDHSSMVADVYSLGGDCYAKLGRDNDARNYYNLSYAKDWIVNYWAIARLAGE